MKNLRLMTKYCVVTVILFFSVASFAQKKMVIPNSNIVEDFIKKLPNKLNVFKLKDLRTSTDSLDIRIWKSHQIFTLKCSRSVVSDYKIYTVNNKPVISTFDFSENISRNILNLFLTSRIMELKNDNYRGIDGSFVFIEISTKQYYKVVSFWSPSVKRSENCKSVVTILEKLHKTINSRALTNRFLNSLQPGNYKWGMTSIHIDNFLKNNTVKTEFYTEVEARIKTDLNITTKTNHWEYPLIIINNKGGRIADLNKYSKSDIAEIEILKPNNKRIVLYGTRGCNGVVILKTEEKHAQ